MQVFARKFRLAGSQKRLLSFQKIGRKLGLAIVQKFDDRVIVTEPKNGLGKTANLVIKNRKSNNGIEEIWQTFNLQMQGIFTVIQRF